MAAVSQACPGARTTVKHSRPVSGIRTSCIMEPQASAHDLSDAVVGARRQQVGVSGSRSRPPFFRSIVRESDSLAMADQLGQCNLCMSPPRTSRTPKASRAGMTDGGRRRRRPCVQSLPSCQRRGILEDSGRLQQSNASISSSSKDRARIYELERAAYAYSMAHSAPQCPVPSIQIDGVIRT